MPTNWHKKIRTIFYRLEIFRKVSILGCLLVRAHSQRPVCGQSRYEHESRQRSSVYWTSFLCRIKRFEMLVIKNGEKSSIIRLQRVVAHQQLAIAASRRGLTADRTDDSHPTLLQPVVQFS